MKIAEYKRELTELEDKVSIFLLCFGFQLFPYLTCCRQAAYFRKHL